MLDLRQSAPLPTTTTALLLVTQQVTSYFFCFSTKRTRYWGHSPLFHAESTQQAVDGMLSMRAGTIPFRSLAKAPKEDPLVFARFPSSFFVYFSCLISIRSFLH